MAGAMTEAAATQLAASSVMMDDLMSGLNEWRNIQDVVRKTFKAFHDVLKAQGEHIKYAFRRGLERQLVEKTLGESPSSLRSRLAKLEVALAGKADAAEVRLQLERRPQRAEFSAAVAERASVAEVQHALDMKATQEEVDALARQVESLRGTLEAKADGADVRVQLAAKADVAEMTRRFASTASVGDLASRFEGLVSREQWAGALGGKADRADVEVAVSSLRDDLLEFEHQKLRAHRDEAAALRAELKRHGEEMGALRDEQRALAARARDDSDTAAAALRAFNANFDGALAEVRRQMAATEEAAASASGGAKGGVDSLWDALQDKADREEMRHFLEMKADVVQVNEALAQKANIAAVNSALERVESSKAAAAASRAELSDKANTRDVCALVDTKASVDDVNRVLSEVNAELEARATVDDLRRVVRDQAAVNASLCAESAVARWIWKSGRTKAGNAVPWNVQAVNTDPANFLWEKDKATLVTVAPGLYEVTFGFFTHKKPSVSLLVNGEPVLAAVNSASYVVHHSSGRLTSAVGRHPAGNVTGLTLLDFLALPAKARIAITYAGEERGEGFLSLKKL